MIGFNVRRMLRLYILAAVVFVYILTESVVGSVQGVRYPRPIPAPGTVGMCDNTEDCYKDIDCVAGLVCAHEHQELLKALGYDERGANCENIEAKPWNWYACFDPIILGTANNRNETVGLTQYNNRDRPDMKLMDDTSRSLTGTLETQFCVYNSSMLVSATNQAISIGPNYTRIDVCSTNIKLWRSLNVTNKRIELSCKMKRCVIDALRRSRFMIGKNSNILLNGVEFVHGYSKLEGTGAFHFQDSTVVIRNVQFRANNFTKGAIIYSDISSLTQNKQKPNITMANITFQNNVASHVLFFAKSSVRLNYIKIHGNPNSSAVTAIKNTDLTMMSSSITNNTGLDYFFMLFNESKIMFSDISIENNVANCLLSTDRSNITILKSSITNNEANGFRYGGYRYGMLSFRDSTVNMNAIAVISNRQIAFYGQSDLEFVNSNVSMINAYIYNNYAHNGPNLYVTNSHCVLTSVTFFFNGADCFYCNPRTMELTLYSSIMMYNTTIYDNLSPSYNYGYLILTDSSIELFCDEKSYLSYNYELSDGNIQGNCTFF